MKVIQGLLVVLAITLLSFYLSNFYFAKAIKLGPLTIALIIGILYSNTIHKYTQHLTRSGVDFSQSTILKLGIILYGFRITFQEIYSLGPTAFLVNIFVVTTIILSGIFIGVKVLKLDYKLSLLVAAGSGICGGAAVLATGNLTKAKSSEVATAIVTVVIFGSIAMISFPYILQMLEFNDHQMGVLIGGTIHGLPQTIIAGSMISVETTANALISKLARVMLIIPVLLIVTYYVFKHPDKKDAQKESSQSIWSVFPWFAFLFVLSSGINSLNIFSSTTTNFINICATFFLTMAMSAVGIKTSLRDIKNTGLKPFLLAAILLLMLGSYLFLPFIVPI